MSVEADVLGLKSQASGDLDRGRRRDFEPLGQLRQLEIGGERPALAPARDANDVADRLLEHDPEILSGEQVARIRWAISAAAPTVGWPANGNSRLGVKILTRALLMALLGSKTNTVSDRLNSAAIACMRASSRPSASRTTASGLPASAVSVKTSSVETRRVINVRRPSDAPTVRQYQSNAGPVKPGKRP